MSDVVFEIGGSAKGAEAAVKHLQREIAQLQTNLHYAHLSANADAQKYVTQLEEVKAAMKAAGDEALAKQADKHAAALEKVREQMERLKAEYAETSAEAEKQNDVLDRIGGYVRNAALSVAGMVTSYVSVRNLLQQVTAEMERQKELEGDALDAQTGQAVRERNYLQMMGVQSAEDVQSAQQLIADTSAKTSMPQSVLMEAAPILPSAAGSVQRENWDDFLAGAAAISPAESGALKANLAGLLDLANAIRTQDPDEAAGFLNQLSQMVRPENREQIARNLVPALSTAQLYDASAEDAAAAAGAITIASVDTQGAQTKTALIALAQQLEELVPEGGTFDERIRILQQDETRRTEFLGEATFEKAALGAIRELLTAGSATAGLYDERRAMFPDRDVLAAQAREQRQAIEDTPLQRQGRLAESFARDREEFLLEHPDLALTEQIRQALTQYDTEVAEAKPWNLHTALAEDFSRQSSLLEDDPVKALEQIVMTRIERLQTTPGGTHWDFQPAEQTEAQRLLDILERAAETQRGGDVELLPLDQIRIGDTPFSERTETLFRERQAPQEGDQAAAGRRDEEMLGALRGIHRELELQRLERNGPLPANAFVAQVG